MKLIVGFATTALTQYMKTGQKLSAPANTLRFISFSSHRNGLIEIEYAIRKHKNRNT